MRDAIDMRRVNAQLEEADQLNNQFLSIVLHELKTPMTTILARTQLLQRRLSRRRELLSDATRLCRDLEKIEQQTNRMNALVDDLLDWSRIRSGRMELSLSSCDLGAICRTVIEDQHLVSGRTLELELPLAPVLLQADRHRLSQVMTNLVSNALKYSPDDTSVHIAISQSEQETLIRITDSGPGIPEQQRSRIFELFYRTPQARESLQSGQGLGLAICKEIVEMHGGRIWCESVIGQGSTFIVQLPLR